MGLGWGAEGATGSARVAIGVSGLALRREGAWLGFLPAMLRALIFDFDGLIVDTETVLIDAWARLHEEDNVPCRREYMHQIVGHTDVAHDPWIAYAPEADRVALDERYRRIARELTLAAPVRPGVRALLDAARAAGLRLAVASNSSHLHVDGHLAHRGLLSLFDHIACRDDVARGKPEPDVYLAALQGLGLNADGVVAFEDSVPGHEAAARARLHVVVAPNPSTAHFTFPHAHWQVPSLADVTLTQLRQRFG